MYILKVSQSKDIPAIFHSNDGYKEVETLQEAIELYTELTNKYPNSLDIKIFESKEIAVPDSIKEEAIKRRDKEIELLMKMRSLGLDSLSIVDIQEANLIEKIYNV